ncbi:MAG: hypothetical protein GXO79_13720 [Chlorobi bacterium]|nr:hypothetical protein [Chlorobiota bacterium]
MKKLIPSGLFIKNILTIVIIVSLSFCSTSYYSSSGHGTKSVEIQVIKPATIDILKQYNKFGLLYLQKRAVKKPLLVTQSEKEIIHEDAKKSCLNGLYEYFTDSGKTDSVKVFNVSNNYFKGDSLEVNWEKARLYCTQNNLDALIYISRLKITNAIYSNSTTTNNNYGNVEIKTTWTVLLPEVDSIIKKDITYHKIGHYSESIDKYIQDIAENLGEKFGKQIVPGWSKTNRKYFASGNAEFRKAAELVNDDNWEDAAKIWNNSLSDDNKIIVGKAYFNLALYYELQGNLDKAFEMAKISDQTYKTSFAHDYAGILYQRINDQYKLAEQLNTL